MIFLEMSDNDDADDSLNFPEVNREPTGNSDGEELSQENITRAVEASFQNQQRWNTEITGKKLLTSLKLQGVPCRKIGS